MGKVGNLILGIVLILGAVALILSLFDATSFSLLKIGMILCFLTSGTLRLILFRRQKSNNINS